MKKIVIIFILAYLMHGSSCSSQYKNNNNMDSSNNKTANKVYSHTDTTQVILSNEEWKKILPPEVFHIAREKGTESPFTSKYETSKDTGVYYCAACGNALFRSDTKFESGCGWPSFFAPVHKNSIIYAPDHSHGMERTEVMCGRCHAHLGHVFTDGPPPTGLRYCINGVVLNFEETNSVTNDKKEDIKK